MTRNYEKNHITDIIKNYTTPTNIEDVERFIALRNYCKRFIKDFTKITKDLNNLLNKKKEFKQTEEKKKPLETLSPTTLQ